MEISSKMKRKHQIKSLKKFNILEKKENFVHVEYPEIKAEDNKPISDENLKEIALRLLSTGVVNTLNVLRDGVEVDVFDIKNYQKQADQNFAESRKHGRSQEQLNHEIRVKREREQKQKKNEDELKALFDLEKSEQEAQKKKELEDIKEMEANMKVLSGNLDMINSKIKELQTKQDEYKSLRKAYEKKHGFENGDELLEKAMEDIRKRQN